MCLPQVDTLFISSICLLATNSAGIRHGMHGIIHGTAHEILRGIIHGKIHKITEDHAQDNARDSTQDNTWDAWANELECMVGGKLRA